MKQRPVLDACACTATPYLLCQMRRPIPALGTARPPGLDPAACCCYGSSLYHAVSHFRSPNHRSADIMVVASSLAIIGLRETRLSDPYTALHRRLPPYLVCRMRRQSPHSPAHQAWSRLLLWPWQQWWRPAH
jgi:hypothetical protein